MCKTFRETPFNFEQQDLSKASGYLNRALILDRTNARALAYLETVYCLQKQLPEALV